MTDHMGQSGGRYMTKIQADDALCRPGASAFHVNSGERWTVVERLSMLRLRVCSSRGNERVITEQYWLSEAWADD